MSVSTHVLDAAAGKPAVDVGVRFERRNDDGWQPLGEYRTDADGRVEAVPGADIMGVYRLTFDVEGVSDFFPEVTIVFRISDPGQHHHVPLLLSPFAYSTYRGS